MVPSVRMAYVDTGLGQIHCAEAGTGRPVVLLHQTPQSWDEFRDVLPLLAARGHRAIAVDMPGFGNSPRLPAPQTIEQYADGVGQFLDALDLGPVALVGHHTGAAVALELAASRRDVRGLVLSSCPWTDAGFRTARAGSRGVDDVDRSPAGTHLADLWEGRRPYYPAGDVALLDRFLADALRPGLDPAEGHLACARYRMEDRAGAVLAPVLLMAGGADPFALPALPHLAAALTATTVRGPIVVEGGTVALPQQNPDTVCGIIADFLDELPD